MNGFVCIHVQHKHSCMHVSICIYVHACVCVLKKQNGSAELGSDS